MIKAPIVVNGNEIYPSDLRKSSSGTFNEKLATTNGYTLNSDAILHSDNHRHSSTDSVNSFNTINSTISNGSGVGKGAHLDSNGITLKSLKEQGLFVTKMQTLKNGSYQKLSHHCNNGKLETHRYPESVSTSCPPDARKSPYHLDLSTSLAKYVRSFIPLNHSLMFLTISFSF